ncbi:MAG: histidine phosphatase family protein [Clostridia bacterium]|nr:histidine phosphatase family protein [Clostridia bacterium]MBP5270083.1 histidine phosphatase family protein [Clostridia bacterium]
MSKTTVYIVRHGETFFNAVHRFIGCGTDHPLCDRGKAQAATLRGPMLAKKIDRIYSSPCRRTLMTAEEVRAGRDIEIVEAPGIREIYCGQWEGKNRDEIEALWPGTVDLWHYEPEKLRMPDGESFAEVKERAVAEFCGIIGKERGSSVAVVSHMLTIQLIMGELLGIPVHDVWNMVRLENTSITTMEIYENGDFEVTDWARDDHLPPELRNSQVKIAGFVSTGFSAKYDLSSVTGRRHYSGFELKQE